MKTQFHLDFEAAFVSAFPQAKPSKTIRTPEITATMKKLGTSKYPLWMMKDRISRGLYRYDFDAPLAQKKVTRDTTSTKKSVKKAAIKPQPHVVQLVAPPAREEGQSLIPAVDPTFVSYGKNYSDLDTIIKSCLFYPVYISGPSGAGKSTMVEQICAKQKREMIRINFNAMSDEDQLLGSKTLEDGTIKIVEGPVLIAMRRGAVICCDEIDAGSANTLLCLQPILEGKPYYFKLKNELVVPAPGFMIVATGNTKGKGSEDGRYMGTNVLNEAFLERFAVTFEQEYPSAAVELKIVKTLMVHYNCMDEDFAQVLVKWSDAIRRTFEDGGVDETITTRRIGHIIRAFSIFSNKPKAIELCCSRFDEATKRSFLDLYDKIQDPANIVPQEPAEANATLATLLQQF